MKTLIINIKQLVQIEEEPRKWVAGADMAKLGIIDDAYLLINEDKIEALIRWVRERIGTLLQSCYA